MAQPWRINGVLRLDENQRRPAPAPRFRQTLQRALANGKRWPAPWTNMVKECLEELLPFLL